MTPHVSTIQPDASFVDELAYGVWQKSKGDPAELSQQTIFLSTRRACRHLRDAFLRIAQGQSTLLPQLVPLGDADEDDLYFATDSILPALKPAIPSMRRLVLLARLVQGKDPSLSLDRAASLAEALARLIDEVQTVDAPFDQLEKIVPDTLSKHWQETLKFLEIITHFWPELLKEEGCLDPVHRRNIILRERARLWTKTPPQHAIMIAGSTGSVPAVANLMTSVAHLEKGSVVLPGLDQDLDEEAWQAITESHPQYGMKQWIESLPLDRSHIEPWPSKTDNARSPRSQRVRLLQESMRPASVTEGWLTLDRAAITDQVTNDFSRLEVDTQQTEAETIALCLRAALEQPEKTAALITPDRHLASRVSLALQRWGIEADDSAGFRLLATPLGGFIQSVIACLDPMASPVSYLALLKHPLMGGNLPKGKCREAAAQIEKKVWRGVRLAHGWQGASESLYRQAEEKSDPNLRDLALWIKTLSDLFDPFKQEWKSTQTFSERLDAFLKLCESLSTTNEQSGEQRLWRGEEGGEAAKMFIEARQSTHDLAPMDGITFVGFLSFLISRVTIRVSYGHHPRLSILGPLEARLWHADLVILGGLNEGTWPLIPPADPWMSRPMKRDFGLPLPERRIGLSAHDFVQCASAPQVLMTRARRVDGTPTVPSRFLLQVEVVLRALGLQDDQTDALKPSEPWDKWAKSLDEPTVDSIIPTQRPAPIPPLDFRPKEIWVTDIRLWQRNPYAFYAKRILKLRKLDPIDMDVTGAEFGNLLHKVFEAFIQKNKTTWPKKPHAEIDTMIDAALEPYADRPQIMTFWRPRMTGIATWFLAQEQERRQNGIKPLGLEVSGQISFTLHDITLLGRVDRIDRLPDGSLDIIDYKTGSKVPKKDEILWGLEPQLPLLGAIAQRGGFKDIGVGTVGTLSYWHMRGKEEDKIVTYEENTQTMIENAQKGIESLIATFADPNAAYAPTPRPRFALDYDDYDHLARTEEWRRA